MCVAGIIIADILVCSSDKKCEYIRREPDTTERHVSPFYMSQKGVVVASGAQIEVNPRWGEFIGKIEDEKSLYYIRPKELEEMGHFTVVNGDGSKTTIDLNNLDS